MDRMLNEYTAIKSDITNEITGNYASARQSIAEKLLDIGYDWAKVSRGSKLSKRELRKQCREYIVKNNNLKPVQFGLSSIFFFFVLRILITWVANKILDRMFKDKT